MVEDLRIERDGVPAVAELSYMVDRPGWIGITGANDSGKTTLLRALSGRLPVRSGQIAIAGTDRSHDRAARAELIGFAIESRMLPPDLTPREVFAITARDRDALDAKAIRGLRDALDVENFLDRKCGALSAGMGQRIAVLGAFLGNPDVVLLDEPFNWLDPLTAYDLKIALRDLIEAQKTTLITALHDVMTLTHYCDRGILMTDGRIALCLEEAELRAGLVDPIGFEAFIVAQLRKTR